MKSYRKLTLQCISLLVLGLFVSSCGGGQLRVSKKPYTSLGLPDTNETLVFVFRESRFTGGGRKMGIIANDTYMAVLTNGSFSQFKVKGEENEIVCRIAPSFAHYRIQNRGGQIVYLLCGLSLSGLYIDEIDEGKANGLMKELGYTEIGIKNRKANTNFKTYVDDMYK